VARGTVRSSSSTPSFAITRHTSAPPELQRWARPRLRADPARELSPSRRRGDQPLARDYAAAAGYYGDRARAALGEIEGAVPGRAIAFGQAFPHVRAGPARQRSGGDNPGGGRFSS